MSRRSRRLARRRWARLRTAWRCRARRLADVLGSRRKKQVVVLRKFTMVILRLPAARNGLVVEDVTLPAGPVPVAGSDLHAPPIGLATLRREGDCIVADIEIRDDVGVEGDGPLSIGALRI